MLQLVHFKPLGIGEAKKRNKTCGTCLVLSKPIYGLSLVIDRLSLDGAYSQTSSAIQNSICATVALDIDEKTVNLFDLVC